MGYGHSGWVTDTQGGLRIHRVGLQTNGIVSCVRREEGGSMEVLLLMETNVRTRAVSESNPHCRGRGALPPIYTTRIRKPF